MLMEKTDRQIENDRARVTRHRMLNIQYRFFRADGELRVLHSIGTLVREDGEVARFVGATQDITEKEKRTEDLKRSEAYLAEAQRVSHTGSFGWNIATGEIIWSDETFRIFECDQATKPTLDVILQTTHPEDRARMQQFLEHVVDDGREWDFEHRLLMPDGSVKYVHTVAHAVKDASGKLTEFVGAVMDITPTRRAERELHQAQTQLTHVARVTTLGELTASIAHEVSQPLAGVVSSADACLNWLTSQPPSIGKARQSVERIIRDANRAREVVGRVRSLAKKTPLRRIWLNINEIVQETVMLARREVEQNRVSLTT